MTADGMLANFTKPWLDVSLQKLLLVLVVGMSAVALLALSIEIVGGPGGPPVVHSTSSPSARAVGTLMTSSKLVDRTTGNGWLDVL